MKSMKKRMSYILIVLLLCSFLVASKEITNKIAIGDSSELFIDSMVGTISYLKIFSRTVLELRPIYYEDCSYAFNISSGGVDEICITRINDSAEEIPIYSYGNIKALSYSGIRYNFINKGCFICDKVEFEDDIPDIYGRLLLCLSNQDGYNKNLGCKVESGTSYSIKNLENNSLLKTEGDFGIEIE